MTKDTQEDIRKQMYNWRYVMLKIQKQHVIHVKKYDRDGLVNIHTVLYITYHICRHV